MGETPAVDDVTWLSEHLRDPDLLVLDASVGPEREESRRIPGARRFDLDGEMSDLTTGLPHSLPTPEVFTENCRRLGISPHTRVVVYDAAGIFSSPRARWMLRTAGHERTSVLDGGLPAWVAAGLDTEPWTDDAPPEPGTFTARPFAPHVVDLAQVERLLDDSGTAVVDARSRGRFAGTDPEPRPGIDSGHMPGSVNLPFTDLLEDGRFRSSEQLVAAVESTVAPGQELVVSCGSGVTACVVALAAEVAGTEARLYDGSWSEWATRAPDRIARTDR